MLVISQFLHDKRETRAGSPLIAYHPCMPGVTSSSRRQDPCRDPQSRIAMMLSAEALTTTNSACQDHGEERAAVKTSDPQEKYSAVPLEHGGDLGFTTRTRTSTNQPMGKTTRPPKPCRPPPSATVTRLGTACGGRTNCIRAPHGVVTERVVRFSDSL